MNSRIKLFLNGSLSKKIFFCLILLFFAFNFLNGTARAACSPTSSDPLGCLTDVGTNSGYTDSSVEQILVNIINASLSLLFLVVMGFLIYGGYFWMTSMGNEEKIKKSKQILTASIVGLLIILSSLAIINFISNALGLTPPNLPQNTGLPTGSLDSILYNIINAFLTLVGAIALVMTVYGGFRWMTAAGNEDTVNEAKRILTASAIGLVIIIISWSVVNFVIVKTVGG